MKTAILLLLTSFVCAVKLIAQDNQMIWGETYNKLYAKGIIDSFKDVGKLNDDKKRIGFWKDYVVFDRYFLDTGAKYTEVSDQVFLEAQGEYKNGKLTGLWKYYVIDYPAFNLHPYREVTYDNGKPVGIMTYYYTSGKKVELSTTKNDCFDGQLINYHPNGEIALKRFFKNCELEGVAEDFFNNKQLDTRAFYKKGVAEGESVMYHSNGQVFKKLFYINGKLNGKYQRFYNNGQLANERIYKDDVIVEMGKSYDINGKELDSGNFKAGNGEMRFYTEEGKLMSIEYYENGVKYNEDELIEIKSFQR